MKLSQERQGEMFAFGHAALWGLFPVITVLTYNKLSPLFSLAISLLFTTFFFAIILTIKKKWHEIKNKAAIKDMLASTFFISILYYLFYFFGLSLTSPGNASIIALSGVFFSFIFFHVWRREYIAREHIFGALLMIAGALIIFYPNIHGFHLGDLLILAAAFVTPFGNFFIQRARKRVSSETILFVRSFINTLVILPFAILMSAPNSANDIASSLLFLAINGIILLGLSKILWVEQIHRITVMKANALSSISPLFTLLFAWMFLKTAPTLWQLIAFIPMFLA